MRQEHEHTITNIKNIATLLVVILHAYTVSRGIQIHNSYIYTRISYILSLGFGQMAVPLFFFLSGYLYFYKYTNTIQCYKKKCKKRFFSLFIPYIFWNTLMIIFYYLIQSIPYFDSFFSGDNLEIKNYTLANYIRAYWDSGYWNHGNSFPILQPYWYIRNLILLSILSPAIAIIIKYTKWLISIITIILWTFSTDLALSYVSIAFFTLGSTFSIYKLNFINRVVNKSKLIVILFIFLITTNYIIHYYTPYDVIPIHRIMLFIGVSFIILIVHKIKLNMNFMNKLGNASFFIYTLHLPIMIAIRKLEYRIITYTTELTNIILYLAAIVGTIFICYIVYIFTNNHFPKLTRFISGR